MSAVGPVFFFSYIVLVTILLINIVLAIVVDAFSKTRDNSGERSTLPEDLLILLSQDFETIRQVSFISIYCVTQYYTILMTHFNDLIFSSSHHRESSSGCRRFISKCFRSFSLCGPSLCYASCCCLTVCWPLLRACRTACDGALPPRISCDERIATR